MYRIWDGTQAQRVGLLFGIPTVVLISAGCAGREHYVRGMDYVEAGEHDQGVVELREAVRAEPDNTEYKSSLADAESASAEMHFERADRLMAEGRLAEARSELQRTLELMPGHPKAPLLLNEVNAQLGGAATSAPAIAENVPAMPPPGPTPVPAAPPQPTVAASSAGAVQTRPDMVTDQLPDFPPGSYPGTLSRDDSNFPKEAETLDGIIVRLKDTTDKPIHADIEVRVGKLVKRYRELREGSRVTGRGESRRPYQITILGIEPESETVSFVVEPLTRLPPR
jgi:hypothetical protein